MRRVALRIALVSLVVAAHAAPVMAKRQVGVAYTASSLAPWLEYALNRSYCEPIEDAFNKRSCIKHWRTFRKRLFSWIKQVTVVDEDIPVTVHQYDFKRGAFKVTFERSGEINDVTDIQNQIVVGKSRCDKPTKTAKVGQTITVKVPVTEAKKHPLRTAAGEETVTALLSGKPGKVTWCCNASDKETSKRSGTNCSPPVFAYTVRGFRLTADKTFRHRFPARIAHADFEPAWIGGHIPAGKGRFNVMPKRAMPLHQGYARRRVFLSKTTISPARGPGQVDIKAATRALNKRHASLGRCLTRHAQSHPTRQGDITIGLRLGAAGVVQHAGVLRNVTGNIPLAHCVTRLVRRTRFQIPAGGAVSLNIIYRLGVRADEPQPAAEKVPLTAAQTRRLKTEIKKVMKRGLVAYRAGHYQLSIRHFKRVLALDKDHLVAKKFYKAAKSKLPPKP